MTLEIPVSGLSAKVLAREFGSEPIAITRFHPLWMFIRPHVTRAHATHAGPIARMLTARVQITGSDELMGELRNFPNDAGILIHRLHLDQMMRHVWTCSLGKTPATAAIKSFFEIYDLCDDDYSIESAYRSWQRFRTDFEKVFSEKSVQKAANHVRAIGRPADMAKPRLSDTELDDMAREICTRLRFSRPNTPAYLFRQIMMHVYSTVGNRSTDYIAKRFGRSIRRVNVAKRRIEGYLAYDEAFALCFRPISGQIVGESL